MAKSTKAKDSIPEKLIKFFTRKNPVPGTVRKKQVEYVVTQDLLKEIGVEVALTQRMRTLRDLCEVVSVKLLEDRAVETLWLTMNDLLQPSMPMETRHCALNFLKHLIKGQSEKLDILRAHFFRVIKAQNSNEDVIPTFEIFQVLTDNGKELLYFEEETGPFLLEWMPQIVVFGKVPLFMELLSNVIKYNAAYLDPEIIFGFVRECYNSIIILTPSEFDIEATLKMLDVVIAYSYLSPESMHFLIKGCCQLFNTEKFCQASWKLMSNLLGTHLGHRGIYTLCHFMQDSMYVTDVTLLRGAVFCTGMSLWGSQKVKSLKHTPASVLPSFLKVLSSNNLPVAYEVALSMQRLVKKYHQQLYEGTWGILFEIIVQLIKIVESHSMSKETFLVKAVNELITAIENIYESNEMFYADQLFQLVEKFSHMRPEASVIGLILYRAKFISPWHAGWIQTLVHLMDRFYKNESNPTIRIKTLDVLSSILSTCKHLYEDDLIESVVLPNFTHLESDPQVKVRNVVVQLLVDLAAGCHSQRCLDILDIIKKVIEKPFDVSHSHKGSATNDTLNIVDASELLDVKTAVLGLVDIFKIKLYQLPASHAHRVFV